MRRANVKPLTHWVIYKKYTMRFTGRQPDLVTGVLITPEGPCNFEYDPIAMRITLLTPHDTSNGASNETSSETIHINEYGWETMVDTNVEEVGDA